MSEAKVQELLASMERRLAVIADQVAETRAQAQHAHERVNQLRRDLAKVRAALADDTGEQASLRQAGG